MLPIKVIDLRWSASGDLVIGKDGDLGDTKSSISLSFIQEIKTRIKSSTYDWATQPHIGASLPDLLGRLNNRETAEDGKARIMNSLTQDSFLDPGSVQVNYAPISPTTILFTLTISTPFRDIGMLTFNTLVDIEESSVVFV